MRYFFENGDMLTIGEKCEDGKISVIYAPIKEWGTDYYEVYTSHEEISEIWQVPLEEIRR